MEITKEERKELEKKYKEQRRAMWAGKRPSSTAQEERLEKTSEISERVDKLTQGSNTHAVAHHNRTRTKPLDENRPTKISSQANVSQSEQTRLSTKDIVRKNRGNTVLANDYSDSQQMIQKSRSQREDIWERNSATHSRERRRWRGTAGKVGKFWNPTRQEEEIRPHRWKLALGVFGAIVMLVSVGILLGYWFAG